MTTDQQAEARAPDADAGFAIDAQCPNGPDSVVSCGPSCTPCVPPANATATCDGVQCGFTCNVGTHECSGSCLSNTSVNSCGTSCKPCAVPPGGTTATCDGAACGMNVPTFTLTLASFGIAGAMGSVTPNPSGTSCGTNCYTYTQGQIVTIMPNGTGNSLLGGWSGDCGGQSGACTLTMSVNRSSTAHFRPKMNIMFVSSQGIQPSNIGADLAAADKFCADAANAANLGGTTWRSWLATSPGTTNINAAAHVGASTTGWIRVDGLPFATSIADLTAGKVLHPPRLTEIGTDRSEFSAVLSAANGDGSYMGFNCSDWTSANVGSLAVGTATATKETWSAGFTVDGDPCSNYYPVYCFENDGGMNGVTVPAIPAGGRRAFLSKTTWTPGGGVAAADAVCQGDAAAAGLSNTSSFRALLTTSVAATDPTRFNLNGQPWYRLDGVQLVATAADLGVPAGGNMLTTLNVDAAGNYAGQIEVWTGSGQSPGSLTSTVNCGDWTSGSPSMMGWYVLANNLQPYQSQQLFWASQDDEGCNVALSVYCLEN